jgi:hypothetical protein
MAAAPQNRESFMRARFLAQAEGCLSLGSPFTAGLCRALARVLSGETEVGRRCLDWPSDPEADALPLRLCGALHALVLDGTDKVLAAAFPPRAAPEFVLSALLPATLRDHDRRLAAALDVAPQTNEVARAAMLLPGMLLLARECGLPLSLHEIGASAGLNGLFPRLGYRYGAGRWGDADSPVQLAPEVRGAAVPLEGNLQVARIEASDAAPLRLTRPAEKLRLRSFVWPDQALRLARLDRAIALASETRLRPPAAADAAAAVSGWLERRRPGETAVLFHSITWQYLSAETKRAVVTAMAAAGAAANPQAPLAWLRMEPFAAAKGAGLSLTLWPGGQSRHLADCDFHGRWIAWR